MNSVVSNAIFFSKRNIELAGTLKRVCKQLSTNVINCDEVSSFIMRCVQIHPDIIFFDITGDFNDPVFIQHFCQKGFYFVSNVVVLRNKTQAPIYLTHDNNFMNICEDEIEQDLYDVANKIKLAAFKDRLQKFSLKQIDDSLIQIMSPFCFNKKHKGYKYIKDAVTMICKNNGVYDKLIQNIYPAIAAKNNISIQCVERNIRNAIEYAWLYTDKDIINEKLFKYNRKVKKPTNLQVISMTTERVLNNCMSGIKEREM